jgi:hypothetical protein
MPAPPFKSRYQPGAVTVAERGPGRQTGSHRPRAPRRRCRPAGGDGCSAGGWTSRSVGRAHVTDVDGRAARSRSGRHHRLVSVLAAATGLRSSGRLRRGAGSQRRGDRRSISTARPRGRDPRRQRASLHRNLPPAGCRAEGARPPDARARAAGPVVVDPGRHPSPWAAPALAPSPSRSRVAAATGVQVRCPRADPLAPRLGMRHCSSPTGQRIPRRCRVRWAGRGRTTFADRSVTSSSLVASHARCSAMDVFSCGTK